MHCVKHFLYQKVLFNEVYLTQNSATLVTLFCSCFSTKILYYHPLCLSAVSFRYVSGRNDGSANAHFQRQLCFWEEAQLPLVSQPKAFLYQNTKALLQWLYGRRAHSTKKEVICSYSSTLVDHSFFVGIRC